MHIQNHTEKYRSGPYLEIDVYYDIEADANFVADQFDLSKDAPGKNYFIQMGDNTSIGLPFSMGRSNSSRFPPRLGMSLGYITYCTMSRSFPICPPESLVVDRGVVITFGCILSAIHDLCFIRMPSYVAVSNEGDGNLTPMMQGQRNILQLRQEIAAAFGLRGEPFQTDSLVRLSEFAAMNIDDVIARVFERESCT